MFYSPWRISNSCNLLTGACFWRLSCDFLAPKLQKGGAHPCGFLPDCDLFTISLFFVFYTFVFNILNGITVSLFTPHKGGVGLLVLVQPTSSMKLTSSRVYINYFFLAIFFLFFYLLYFLSNYFKFFLGVGGGQ